METSIKAKFTSILTNWIRLYFHADQSNKFPVDIVQLIVNIFLYEQVKFLTFSSKFKSYGTGLSADSKTAYNTGNNTGYNMWVIPDCDPVQNTVAVWRITVGPSPYIIKSINATRYQYIDEK